MARIARTTITHLKDGVGSERDLLRCVTNTGAICKEDIKTYFPNVSERRLDLMVRNSFLKKVGDVYRQGEAGLQYAKLKMGMEFHYKSKGTTITHDLRLCRTYLTFNRDEWMTWKPEGRVSRDIFRDPELRRRHNDMVNDKKWANARKLNFTVDAVVTVGGVEVCIEVVTDNYSKQDIAQKTEFAREFYGGRMVMIR